MRRRACLVAALTAPAMVGLARLGAAHPFHATLAEVRYNANGSSLEVALRVAPSDLEDALSRRAKGRVTLERRADIDKLITAYLADTFVVTQGDGSVKPRWVGKEIESHQIAWLFFEFRLPAATTSVMLRNWAFFELAARQLNTVNVRVGKRKQTLTFSPGARQKAKPVHVAATPTSRGK